MTISSARIQIRFDVTQTNALDVTEVSAVTALSESYVFTNGTSANQASAAWTDTRTLSASASETLDLVGSLTDAIGTTVSMDRIKAIYIKADSANTNSVRVTRSSSNGAPIFLAASDGLDVPPGGAFLLVAPDANGIDVTSSTGDQITIANSGSGTSVTYTIAILYTV